MFVVANRNVVEYFQIRGIRPRSDEMQITDGAQPPTQVAFSKKPDG
jgi:hypothetical protein